MQGIEKVHDDGVIAILEVTDADAARLLAGGTKWCTSSKSTAQSYLEDGPLYVIYKNGTKRAQYHEHTAQINNLQNDGIDDPDIILGLYKAGIFNEYLVGSFAAYYLQHIDDRLLPIIYKSDDAVDEYFSDAILNDKLNERLPEAEPFIMKHPETAFSYARYVIEGRWPEAEPIIMKDPYSAYFYAVYVIEDRWPEAEDTIFRNKHAAEAYTAHFMSKDLVDKFARHFPPKAAVAESLDRILGL
jgi:hypothetical protein